VGAAFGYEYRDEQYTFTPDSAKTADQTTGNTGAGTDGGYDVDSFFAEFAVPLLSDVPGAELLELNISARYDDFSTFGNTTNVQYGLRWQPVRSLLIRGTFSEVFREPNVSELFAGQGDSFPNASDPCNTSNIGGLNSAGQAQCSADGVPAGGYAQSDVQVRARVGGNPNLGPEEGDTTTFGLAWSPEFLDGFSATVDYWEVELEQAITALGASTVLDECYRNQHPTLCNNITRLPGGNLNAVETLQQNISTETAKGWDFAANYNMNTDIGLWKFRWLGTLLDEREQVVPGAIPLDAAGRFETRGAFGGSSNQGSFPEWRHNLTVDWAMGDFEASLSMAYIGEMDVCGDDNFGFAGCPDQAPTWSYQRFDGTNVTDPAIDFKVDDVIYFDLVGRYTFSDWGTQLSVGIQNVTDEEPPFIHQGFNSTTDPDTYRMLGRTWFFNLKQSF
jgi:outer membrane receptor protein involved in Fe transport